MISTPLVLGWLCPYYARSYLTYQLCILSYPKVSEHHGESQLAFLQLSAGHPQTLQAPVACLFAQVGQVTLNPKPTGLHVSLYGCLLRVIHGRGHH